MENLKMTTGVATCDEMKELHLEGNVIHHTWYKTIVDTNLKTPKPKLLAINILADIVYWYRPTVVRDEQSGQLLGYKKKFRADLLQRSYKQLADLFGVSVRQAKDAVVFLESIGVIKRVFRDFNIAGNTYSNIMYIALDVARLKALTFPSDEISSEGGTNYDEDVAQISAEATKKNVPPPQETDQYTNTTTSTTTLTTGESPSFSLAGLDESQDDPKKKENQIRAEIYRLAELDFRKTNGFFLNAPKEEEAVRYATYELCVTSLVEICCSGIHEHCSGEEILAKAEEIVAYEHTLCYFLEDAMYAYIEAAQDSPIRNPKSYIRAMLADRLQTYITRMAGPV